MAAFHVTVRTRRGCIHSERLEATDRKDAIRQMARKAKVPQSNVCSAVKLPEPTPRA